MNFEDWFFHSGEIEFDKGEGWAQDELSIAKKAWKTCKAECIKIVKAEIIGAPGHAFEQPNYLADEIAKYIEDGV